MAGTTINELPRVMRWLTSTLGNLAEAPGGCWEGVAPREVSGVFISVTPPPASPDLAGVGAVRIWTDGLWLIKAVGPVRLIGGSNDYAALVAAADQIDALLQRVSGAAAGADCTILYCVRESAVGYTEAPDNGVTWSHLGGMYRIRVQQNGA